MEKMMELLENVNVKSDWYKAVKIYAMELVEGVEEGDFLNGASDWLEYSMSGNSLIYNEDIEERLGKHDNLLEVQAQALSDAYDMIMEVAKEYLKELGYHVHTDWCGTELNEIIYVDGEVTYEPIRYISENEMTYYDVLEYLEEKNKMKKYTDKELLAIVREINTWDGSLPEFDVYDSYIFNEAFEGWEPEKIMNAVHFGNYNPFYEYHRFDGYGNIESLSEADLFAELRDQEDYILELAQDLDIDTIIKYA